MGPTLQLTYPGLLPKEINCNPKARAPHFSSTVAESCCGVEIAMALYRRSLCFSGDRLQEKIIDTSSCCQRNEMSSTQVAPTLKQRWRKHATAPPFIFFLYLFNVFFCQGGKVPQTVPTLEEDSTFSTSSFPSTSLSFLCQVSVESSPVENKRAKLTWDVPVDCRFPSNLDTLKQSRSSVGPVSQTVGQRYTNLVSMRRGLPSFPFTAPVAPHKRLSDTQSWPLSTPPWQEQLYFPHRAPSLFHFSFRLFFI